MIGVKVLVNERLLAPAAGDSRKIQWRHGLSDGHRGRHPPHKYRSFQFLDIGNITTMMGILKGMADLPQFKLWQFIYKL